MLGVVALAEGRGGGGVDESAEVVLGAEFFGDASSGPGQTPHRTDHPAGEAALLGANLPAPNRLSLGVQDQVLGPALVVGPGGLPGGIDVLVDVVSAAQVCLLYTSPSPRD